MTTELPEDGELQLAGVTLPAGKRIRAGDGSRGPVAWVTRQPVQDPGRAWAALSAAAPETGLVPFLLSGLDGRTKRPWDEEEFSDPEDVTALDRVNAADALREMWAGTAYEVEFDGDDGDEDDEEDERTVERRAPFSRRFPGLAPAEGARLSQGQLDGVLALPDPSRLGLAPAGRPADVLPRIGWNGAVNSREPGDLAVVLRSWEDRFGARLLDVGFDTITLLVERPPRSHETALRLAAEQFAFCDECRHARPAGPSEIRGIAAGLINNPVWGFWWD